MKEKDILTTSDEERVTEVQKLAGGRTILEFQKEARNDRFQNNYWKKQTHINGVTALLYFKVIDCDHDNFCRIHRDEP